MKGRGRGASGGRSEGLDVGGRSGKAAQAGLGACNHVVGEVAPQQRVQARAVEDVRSCDGPLPCAGIVHRDEDALDRLLGHGSDVETEGIHAFVQSNPFFGGSRKPSDSNKPTIRGASQVTGDPVRRPGR